jgi:hypothetical protein
MHPSAIAGVIVNSVNDCMSRPAAAIPTLAAAIDSAERHSRRSSGEMWQVQGVES